MPKKFKDINIVYSSIDRWLIMFFNWHNILRTMKISHEQIMILQNYLNRYVSEYNDEAIFILEGVAKVGLEAWYSPAYTVNKIREYLAYTNIWEPTQNIIKKKYISTFDPKPVDPAIKEAAELAELSMQYTKKIKSFQEEIQEKKLAYYKKHWSWLDVWKEYLTNFFWK